MPRGGRRPGSGARKGNTNAMTNMNHSPRARVLFRLFLACPDKRPLMELLMANGINIHHRLSPRELRLAVAIFHRYFFDRSTAKQSNTIKGNQTQSNTHAPPARIRTHDRHLSRFNSPSPPRRSSARSASLR
jgi:hypothetical protein